MKKRILLAVVLALAIALTLAMPASASPSTLASGKMAWAGPPMNFVFRQAGNNCFMSTDLAYQFFEGNLDGIADFHWSIVSHGPCPAGPNQYKENLMAWGKFTGTVDGKSGTLNLVFILRGLLGGPDELANTGQIVILSGTGELANLRGVLKAEYYLGDPYDTYSGNLHFEP